ncbi:MAG: hypothetical protein LUQ63_00920 [Methanothrix sp.]|nr:hypothetical protein [Methanothrix sp.]
MTSGFPSEAGTINPIPGGGKILIQEANGFLPRDQAGPKPGARLGPLALSFSFFHFSQGLYSIIQLPNFAYLISICLIAIT